MIELIKVVQVKSLGAHRLWVRFSDGSEGIRDLSDVLAEGGVMVRPLRNPMVFRRVFVERGVPTWPNGFDLDAIALHKEMEDAGLLSPATRTETMCASKTNDGNDALIAQVGGAGRWSQISFNFDTVRNFFGTEPEDEYEICLRQVTATGTLRGEERPKCLYKQSRNWAFELGAATDMDYPGKANRPIAVFLRSSVVLFLYQLLMPGDQDYDLISEYLVTAYKGPSNRLRRKILSAAELKKLWPSSPLWEHWP